MRNAQYQIATDHTARILRESAIVSRAIARHQREAISEGRIKEARDMEALCSGVSRMVLEFTEPYRQSNVA